MKKRERWFNEYGILERKESRGGLSMNKEEKGEPFVFKIYEIAFVSLFISALVSMLEIGSQLRMKRP